jgi:DNA primase
MNAQDVLDLVEKVTGGKGKWMACCPAHQDKSPSLAINEAKDRILIHCFAGCGAEDIAAAIGLNISDLFYSKLAVGELTERKRLRYEEVLKSERTKARLEQTLEMEYLAKSKIDISLEAGS